MKKITYLLSFFALFAFCSTTLAQETTLSKYRRSSLHMILLNTDEPSLPNSIDFSSNISDAWANYPFPDKYDQHSINFKEAYGGKPKGSLIELITKYQGNLGELGLNELKEISATISNNKLYERQLIDTTTIMLKEQKVGQQLLRKWFSIQDDGSWSKELLNERSFYNASQSSVAEANATVRGVQAIRDKSSDELIENTFVSFSKLSFYENEPIAAFSRDLAKTIADLVPDKTGTGMVATAAKAAADATYTIAHEGYSAYTTTVLYKLVWNDSIKALFNSCWVGDKIDLNKFHSIDFPFELLGVQTASTTTIDAIGGLAVVGIKVAGKPKDELIKQTVVRNLDKIFALLQYNYDVFKPLVPIISTNPLLADMGMKESIKDGDKFELLEARLSEKNNKIEYKSIGKLKVVKGKVWDNRYSLTEDAIKAQEENIVKGTELTANKKATLGMVVRQITKKKK